MKKWLYVLLAIEIVSLIISFFAIITNSLLLAILIIPFGILGLMPLIALILCMENIEELKADISYLSYRNKKLEDLLNADNTDSAVSKPPTANCGDAAIATWQCVKCQTVNKGGTTYCSNCKAEYSPFINPTDDPNEKKKMSRWIKEKKKK